MKNKLKLLLIPLLLVSMTSIDTHASTIPNINEITTIAKNSPQYVLGDDKKEWEDVTASNAKPLYDFNDKLIAYSVDLRSNIDNRQAYAIISVSDQDAPVLEFCEGKTSPYDNVDTAQKCIYDGVVSYYSEKTSTSNEKSLNTYYNIKDNSQLSDQEVNIYRNNAKSKKYISSKPEISKSERNKLIKKGSTSVANPTDNIIKPMDTILTTKILSVPDYQWTRGCSPTSAAMVLKYGYSSTLVNITPTSLINQLADAMGTSSSGSTSTSKVPLGILNVMSSYGENIAAWNDPNGAGKSGNTFGEYCTEIDNNHPVIVNVYGNTQTTPSYPDGFKDHSMAGVGYRITTSYDYVIVHDTAVEGNIYLNYDSSAFGTPWWTYVH